MQNRAEAREESLSPVECALENFAVLLDDADFTAELELLGIGRMQFMRKRQMLVECRGLYMALWRLALASSFPQEAEQMFAAFLRSFTQSHPDKLSRRAAARAAEYWGMLEPKGDKDFRDVARHLVSFSERDEKTAAALTLKLVLHIRNAYRIIFEKLI